MVRTTWIVLSADDDMHHDTSSQPSQHGCNSNRSYYSSYMMLTTLSGGRIVPIGKKTLDRSKE
jgi:hypothetical protein